MMRLILKKIGMVILLILDKVAVFPISGKNFSGVALIRLDNIGDLILWLDTAKEYRRLYPNQKIILIANSAWADFARHFHFWDEVWSLEIHKFNRDPFYRWSLLRRIRQTCFQTVIQPTFSRLLLLGDSLIRASAAQQRIGSVGDLSNISTKDKARSDRWYTQLLAASSQSMMELERNAEFISQLSGTPYVASLPRIPVLQALSEDMLPNVDYFILFPGGSWSGKSWPVSVFADLLRQLQRQSSWQAVLCGSPSEEGLCADILSASGQDACINLAGQTSIAELTELIRGARLLVGNDTSAVHISAAVGTPTVCILGGGHYGRFMPYPMDLDGNKPVVASYYMPCYQCNWRCTQHHEKGGAVPCISQITVETVLTSVQQALAQPDSMSLDLA